MKNNLIACLDFDFDTFYILGKNIEKSFWNWKNLVYEIEKNSEKSLWNCHCNVIKIACHNEPFLKWYTKKIFELLRTNLLRVSYDKKLQKVENNSSKFLKYRYCILYLSLCSNTSHNY